VSGKSKALAKNTTRRGGDFLPRPERPRPCFGLWTRTTFAPEIKQKHTGTLIKRKREVIVILWIKSGQEEKQSAPDACIISVFNPP